MTTRNGIMAGTKRGRYTAQIAFAGALVLAGFGGSLNAATLMVTNTNDSGAGSLRAQIAAANAGDTISFAIPTGSTGCTGSACTIALTTGELPITQGITITGPGAKLLTISGSQLSRIFNITSQSAVSISGMTLRDGKTVGSVVGGGAILVNTGAAVTQVTLSGLTITTNNASVAGHSVGGGVSNLSGTVSIANSSIINNTAGFAGGGIGNEGALAGSMSIANSTIAGNTTNAFNGFGGGILNDIPMTLTNVTITGNFAVSGANISAESSSLGLQNTIVAGGVLIGAGGTGPDIAGTVNSLDYNLIANTAGATFTGTTTHNITGVSPKLGSLQDNGGQTPTMAPLSGSPVIDAGSAAGLTTDQRGFTRPVFLPAYPDAAGGDGSDIGAVEVQLVDHLTFLQQPTSAYPGAVISPAVTVQLRDIDNNVVNAADAITIAIGSNPGGGTLSGTKTQNAVNGIATFANLAINNAGVGYTLVAQDPTTVPVASNLFNIGTLPAATPTLTDTGLLIFGLTMIGWAAFKLKPSLS